MPRFIFSLAAVVFRHDLSKNLAPTVCISRPWKGFLVPRGSFLDTSRPGPADTAIVIYLRR